MSTKERQGGDFVTRDGKFALTKDRLNGGDHRLNYATIFPKTHMGALNLVSPRSVMNPVAWGRN